MSKVKVSANEAGVVIIVSQNNPSYGHIKVTQERAIFENGWAKRKVVSAFIPGSLEDLKALGWVKDQELEGKIIAKEALSPFNPKESERDYKVAGKTGIICSVDGKPIYRKTMYTANPNALDETIAHTNGDAIKAAYIALKAAEETTPDVAKETFEL